jgi:N-acylglucosamine 2-epimerase
LKVNVKKAESTELLDFYRMHVAEQLLPFWDRAFDPVNGGIYTCFNNTGEILQSKNKYSWSQGRFLRTWSRLCEMIENSLVEGDLAVYREQIRKTAWFLKTNVFLEDGKCSFLLSETGEKLEPVPGEGYDVSYYADCFVMLGFAEYGRYVRDREMVEVAYEIYRRVELTISSGSYRSEPYPAPDHLDSHGNYMILLDMSNQMYESFAAFDDPRKGEIGERIAYYIDKILDDFCDESFLIHELIPKDPSDEEAQNQLLARHINPGHTIESMWFVMSGAIKIGNNQAVTQAARVIKQAYAIGWDKEFGGILHYVDLDGGKPSGTRIGGKFEQLILDTWDTKLWWAHSEALYSTMFAYDLTKDPEMLELYNKTHEYTFLTFPNPDAQIGEWIQIRTRDGMPLSQVVALPVKDPYHIMRNFLLMIELLISKLR